jgi:Na+/H+ antiporter NhaD/arsenite permease-like protein
VTIPQIITLIIFIVSYLLIFSGKLERTAAALLGLCSMVACGYLFGFTNFEEILTNVDWEVVILLFGMMTYVGVMAKTGFFRYIGVKAVQLSKGRPGYVLLYLTLITAFVSMVVDNVTTVLLMIPLTIQIAEILEINPIPIMLSEALLSNIGGVATLVGDPPNIMIGVASGFSFNDFIVHLLPPVLLSLLLSLLLSKIVYRTWLQQRGKNPEKLLELNPKDYITDRKKMNYLLIVLVGMIISFVLGGPVGVPTAYVALAAGVIALLISMEDPAEAFKSVEWPTLVFFIALFALVGGLTESGVLALFAQGILSIHENLIIIALLVLWITALLSAVVDNIPITAAFIPVVSVMAASYHSGLLWWALAMGVGIGGNLTYVGSSAGVITMSLSKRHGQTITNKEWLRFGVPVGLVGLTVCSVFLFFL